MAGDTRTLTVRWLSDTSGLSKGAKTAVGSIKSVLDSFSKATSGAGSFGDVAAGVFTGGTLLAGVNGVGAAVSKLAGFIADTTKEAIEDQASQETLRKTLEDVTGANGAAVKGVEDWIRKTQNATGVLDDDLRPALGGLVRATGNVKEAQALLSTALDVSAGSGRDLSSVSSALAKAQGGSYGALKRLVPALDLARAKAEGMTYVQRQLNDAFGGQAAAAADTTAGKLRVLSARWHDMKEQIGGEFVPVVNDAASALNGLLIVVDKVPGGIHGITNAMVSIGTNAIPGLGPVVNGLKKIGAESHPAADATNELGKAQKAYADELARTNPDQKRLAELHGEVAKAAQKVATVQGAVTAATDDGATATETATDAEKDHQQALKDLDDALKAHEDRLRTETDAVLANAGAQKQAADAANTVNDDLKALNLTEAASESAQGRNTKANQAYADQLGKSQDDILTYAANIGEAAKQNAALHGKTLDASQSARNQARALEHVRDTINPKSPLYQWLTGLIGQLDNLAHDRQGTLQYHVYVNGQPVDLRGNPAAAAIILARGGRAVAFGEGGYVPGPQGAPVPAVVHGGEYVASTREVAAARAGGAGSGSPFGGAHNTYNVTVNVAPGANAAAVGKATVDAIRAYERRNGASWRAN